MAHERQFVSSVNNFACTATGGVMDAKRAPSNGHRLKIEDAESKFSKFRPASGQNGFRFHNSVRSI
jgi:hypothetical protein